MRYTAVTAAVLSAIVFIQSSEAHKGITSKFTYNADVYPVFLKRCGRCHVDGGVGPMSLLKYEDAFPWAEALRTELLAAASGEGDVRAADGTQADLSRRSTEGAQADFVKAAHRQISARELDIILDWATGGTPQGDATNAPTPAVFTNEWASGTPGLTVAMTKPFEMSAETSEARQEFVLPIALARPLTAHQFDVLPGNAASVRSA
jgi:hypothetical protein